MLNTQSLPKAAAYCTAIAMVGSTVAEYLTSEAIRQASDKSLLFTDLLQKPPAYYWFHGFQVLCVFLAGAFALLAIRANHLRVGAYSFLMLLLASLYIMLRGYDPGVLFSTRIVNPRGPIQCLVCILVFVAVFRSNWKLLTRMLYITTFAYTVYVAYLVATLGMVNRIIAMNMLNYPTNPLFWLAGFVLLKSSPKPSFRTVLEWLPFCVYVVGSFIMQTRLNLVLAFLLVVAFFFMRARTGHSVARPAFLMSLCLMFAAIGWMTLGSDSAAEKISFYYESLQNRLTYDSRSGQIVSFFANVPITSLVWGNGAEATWNWDGMLWKGATDVGYLSISFYGGMLELLGTVFFLIVPAYKVVRRTRDQTELACSLMLILFSVRMFSSEFPSLSNEYYPILLFSGHCWGTILISRYQARCERDKALRQFSPQARNSSWPVPVQAHS